MNGRILISVQIHICTYTRLCLIVCVPSGWVAPGCAGGGGGGVGSGGLWLCGECVGWPLAVQALAVWGVHGVRWPPAVRGMRGVGWPLAVCVCVCGCVGVGGGGGGVGQGTQLHTHTHTHTRTPIAAHHLLTVPV